VLAASPVRLLVKLPVPVPFEVLLLVVVGFWEVDQHIPLAVTAAPPSLVTFPPPDAEFWVIEEMAVVVTVGMTMFCPVVKEI
jgi:hypothetical protein